MIQQIDSRIATSMQNLHSAALAVFCSDNVLKSFNFFYRRCSRANLVGKYLREDCSVRALP